MQFRRLADGGGNLIQSQRRVMTGKFLAESWFIHLDLRTGHPRGLVEIAVTTKPVFAPLLWDIV